MQTHILSIKFFRNFSFLIVAFFLMHTLACKKATPATSSKETGTLTDQDGNVYSTIKIGNQWWMPEDLKVKTYQNGDSVIYEPLVINWQGTTPAYCIYSSAVKGPLYNWYAVNDARKLAPVGWHIPTDDEWKTLEMTLGISSAEVEKVNWRGTNEGDKLKRAAETVQPNNAWTVDPSTEYSVWPNNESGFTAMAGSCRVFNGDMGYPGPGGTGFWWSSTSNNNQAWYRYLDYNKSNIFRFYGDKRYGFSVRCVKD